MAKAKKKTPDSTPSDPILGEYMAEYADIMGAKDELSKQTKKLNERQEYLKQMIITQLRVEGLELIRTEAGTASVKRKDHPAVSEWPLLLKFIIEKGQTQLLKKDVNGAAYRELVESGIEVPGVKCFEEDKLSFVRKRNK